MPRDGAEQTPVDYRTDDATESGEGWPRARASPFDLYAEYGPIKVGIGEEIVEDVSMWAAASLPMEAVSVALAADCDDGSEAATVSYMDPDAARAYAAQLLTAADAVDAGVPFDPNLHRSDERYLNHE